MRRGASLLEVMVAAGLFAVIIPLLFNLIPGSMLSLRRSERLQVATTLAAYRLDETALLDYVPGVDVNEVVALGKHRYQVVREFYGVDIYRVDAVVTVRLLDSEFAPIQLSTRLERRD